jgi:shikimate kinase
MDELAPLTGDVRPIALIGYRGTGKSSVAPLLARRLNWDWVDADVEIELHAGKSIAAIFADEGEPHFRHLEANVVAELCSRQNCVLALGGGAVLRETNRVLLQKCQTVVWLQASVDVLAKRIFGDPTTAARRPNLTNHGGRNEIETLLAARQPFYQGCATLKVDTDNKRPSEIADEIIDGIVDKYVS